MPIINVETLRSYAGLSEVGHEFSYEEFSDAIRKVTGVNVSPDMLKRLESKDVAPDTTVVQMDAIINYGNEAGFGDLPIHTGPKGECGNVDGPSSWKYVGGMKVARRPENSRRSLENRSQVQ